MTTKAIKLGHPVEGTTLVPGSKSITNRALLIAALAEGTSVLEGVLDSEDTRIMRDALLQLGLNIHHEEQEARVTIEGVQGHFPKERADLYVGNSGTTARFLTAALALSEGRYRIYGKPRMHERPIGDLIKALNKLGPKVGSELRNDCPPVLIHGKGVLTGTVSINADISSQFISGLLMAAGASSQKVVLEMTGDPVSRPYIKMTLDVMKTFGVIVNVDPSFRVFTTGGGSGYHATNYLIEPDASAASYVFALPAILGGHKTIYGLSNNSLQGDVRFVDCLAEMGCTVLYEENSITVEGPHDENGEPIPLTGIDEVDMNTISDTVQTLAIVALFAQGPTLIRNVKHIRYKETDRIAAVVTELRKLGAEVDEFEDGLRIWGTEGRGLHGALINTYDDHRMAMSFALAGLRIPNVIIDNPECTQKTWPNYFCDMDL